MKGINQIYQCEECDFETSQWLGRCPNCGAWNTLILKNVSEKNIISIKIKKEELAQPISALKLYENNKRYRIGIREFDNVLGGGIVPGSLVLIGGEPGIGKSTLALQVADRLADNAGKIIYISAEESIKQISLRANRLSVNSDNIYLLSESNLELIIAQLKEIKPIIAIIDSIQTIHDNYIPSATGSISQIKSCTSKLMETAKRDNIALIIIGHVTKDGGIAGPKVLEHIVDTVLYIEGDRFSEHRLLRSIKNRFGTTNEIGIFQMKNSGLEEVENPSELLLSSRSHPITGTVTTVTVEGSRPLVVELEALVSNSFLDYPRRFATGVDSNRLLLIIAILEKKIQVQLHNKDIYINTVGGIKISEPAIDLGIAIAIISSLKNIEIPLGTIVLGELGLTGEVRKIQFCDNRLREARRVGYNKCIIPFDNVNKLSNEFNDCEIKPLKDLGSVLSILKE